MKEMVNTSLDKNKRGQITIFIIVAILLVVAIAGFFFFRSSLSISNNVPAFAEPVYNNFLDCADSELRVAIDLAGTYGGNLEVIEYERGSSYMPFSSHLNFLGNSIPYWYYISSNGVEKTNVPTKNNIEEQISDYLDERVRYCDFSSFNDDGFLVELGETKTDVIIRDNEVEVRINADLTIERNEETAFVKTHSRVLKSNLGKLYDDALEVYNQEQDNLFLEDYGIDTLRLYAPVDGVEITCSPKIWNAEEVFSELRSGIEANTLSLKSKNNDFDLSEEDRKYFVTDLPVNSEVRFLNFQNWPNTLEVEPSEEGVLISKAVGNQAGLGLLGFCYVPYHYVYNLRYPVLIQVQEGDEIFQFPMAVVIEGNNPREPVSGEFTQTNSPPVCEFKNTPVKVNVFDKNLNSIDASISYDCLGVSCLIGDTEFGELEENFPQCSGGFVVAKANGFVESKIEATTIDGGEFDVILSRLYEKEVEINLDNLDYNGQAILNFISDKPGSSRTLIYPDNSRVNLSEGQYRIELQIFRESSIPLQAVTNTECVEIPVKGIFGLFGSTREECFDIEFPSQVVSNTLSGGGSQNYFILESELEDSNVIRINAGSLKTPVTVEDLQDNYILFESKNLGVSFR